MLKDLIKLANVLDSKGLRKEADLLDSIISRLTKQASNDPKAKLGEVARVMVSQINNELANPKWDQEQFGTATYNVDLGLSEEGDHSVEVSGSVNHRVSERVNELVSEKVYEIHESRLSSDDDYKAALDKLAESYNSFTVPIEIKSVVIQGGEINF